MESGFVTRPIESGANKNAEWLTDRARGLLLVDIQPILFAKLA